MVLEFEEYKLLLEKLLYFIDIIFSPLTAPEKMWRGGGGEWEITFVGSLIKYLLRKTTN